MSITKLAAVEHELHLLEARLRSVRQNSEDIALELSEKPNDGDLQAAQVELETSEANILRSMERLTRAKAAAERKRTADNVTQRLSQMRSQVDQVDKLGEQLESLAEDIVDKIEELGPLLQRYENLSGDRSRLAGDVLREGEGKFGTFLRDWQRYGGAATLKHAPAALAMTATLYRIGLGRTGPDVGRLFEIPGPNSLGAFAEQSDVRETLRAQFARQHELLQAGLQKALETVESQRAETAA